MMSLMDMDKMDELDPNSEAAKELRRKLRELIKANSKISVISQEEFRQSKGGLDFKHTKDLES